MGLIVYKDAEAETWSGMYRTEYLTCKGMVERIPVLAAMMDADAEAIVKSWRTYGPNAEALAKELDSWKGNGKQSFKHIMYGLVKTAKICGDSFGEIVYGGKNKMDIKNLIQMPAENIEISVRNGIIKGYQEIDGNNTWKPEEVFHLAWNPMGASCHGTTVIKRLNDLLVARGQVEDDARKIFHRYIKPIHLVGLDTDDQTEIDEFKAEWAKLKDIPESDIFFPKDFAEVNRASVPQFSTLDPATWWNYLQRNMVMSTRIPEVRIGEVGQAYSEATARIVDRGYRDYIRWTQKWLEDALEIQIFPQIFPRDKNKIKFTQKGETPEDEFSRLAQAFVNISSNDTLGEEKNKALLNILEKMKLIGDEDGKGAESAKRSGPTSRNVR